MRKQLFAVLLGLTVVTSSAQVRNLKADKAPAADEEPATAPLSTGPIVDASKPPPATIADLVLLLQSYKPDPAKVQELRTELERPIPDSAAPAELALAWHRRAIAAEELGETEAWMASLEKGLEYAKPLDSSGSGNEVGSYRRMRQDHAFALRSGRGIGASLNAFEKILEEEKGIPNGRMIGVNFHIATMYTLMGDLDRAKTAIDNAENVFRTLRSRRRLSLLFSNWSQFIERARGQWLRRQGRLDEAERAYTAAIRQVEAEVKNNEARRTQGMWAMPVERVENMVELARLALAKVYLDQQRLDEAELLQREVLKASLKRNGRNSRVTGDALSGLCATFIQRGRFAEALVLAGWADQSLAEAGLARVSQERLHARILQANMLAVNGRSAEAVALFDEVRKVVSDDSRLEEGYTVATLNSLRAYITVGRNAEALRDGDKLLQNGIRYYGADHYFTAEARAFRAMALHRNGRLGDARREFERAVGVLVDPAKLVGKQQTSAARARRLRVILNEYLNVLVGKKGTNNQKDIAEAFRVADVARWQSVQKAVTGSALRAAAGSSELGARIKKVQDADDELEAVYKNLISQRSAPPDRQLPAVIATMESRIATLQKEQQSDLAEIRRQFPQYDALVNPRPADMATARKALRPNEALLSVYVTPGGSYVWATGKDGALHFHFSPRTADWVGGMVKRLRASVELGGVGPEQMRFDLEAASALYQELLAPVQAAWGKADTLLVVANESLGQIPFSLLPTANVAPGAAPARPPLAQFRQTPWLARKVAIAYAPSISALVTLRSLPAIMGQRDPFIGFGDPDFGASAEKAASGPGGNRGAGEVARGTRNLKISHAPVWDENLTSADAIPPAPPAQPGTPMLTPLPDTRDEILAIGTALGADIPTHTFFGAQASRANALRADMQKHRVVAFATHGLIAGDLPGLDQPALALAPQPGRDIHDGLLKLEDILKLSLSADLVVLSACNTAAADGSGAEAVSGLGRGFFYAGARAVLATHWPVETVSARELVTHVFQHYAKDGKLTRAKALQQAMLEVIDKGVSLDGRGKAEFSYAHPAFWAPYALYGDPGR